MNAWEEFFKKRLTTIREDELSSLKKTFLSEVAIMSSLFFTSNVVIIAIYGTYMAFGGEINARKAFAILGTFYQL